MFIKRLSILTSLLFLTSTLVAQHARFINNGAKVITTAGATIHTNGEVLNQVSGANNGIITNDGNVVTDHPNAANAGFTNVSPNAVVQGNGLYEIYGDWTNNGIFNGDAGEVMLDGPDQLITGDSISDFNDLTLTGGGTKTMTLDATVSGVLDLTTRELHTDTNTMHVLNTSTGAIVRTGGNQITVEGFVSSDSSGWLAWDTDANSNYYFPVGDSISSPRFRPIELTPSTTNNHTFRTRFANVNATSDGYDITNKQAGIGAINSDFYYHIDRASGSDPADVRLYYDYATDTANMMVHWVSQWTDMGAITNTTNASPQLSFATKTGWNNYSPTPFNIANAPFNVDAGSNDTICAGDTTQLQAVVSGGTGPFGYTWTPSTFLDDSTLQNPTAAGVTTTTTYYVTAYDSTTGATTAPDSVTVVVSPQPSADAGPDQSICLGDTVQIGGAPTASGGTSPYTYAWSNPGSLDDSTLANPNAFPSSDTAYQVTVIDDLGCTADDSISVSVGNPATVNAGVDDTICEGDSLTTTGTFGGSASSVSWTSSGDGTFTNGNTVNATYTPGTNDISNGTVNLIIETDDPAGACPSAMDSLTLIINPQDDATFSYSNTIYCITEPDPSPAVTTAGGTFSEPSGDLSIDPNTGVIDVSASTIGGPYTITYTTTGTCPDSSTFDVSITDQLDATISPSGPYCSYDSPDTLSSADPSGAWSGTGIVDTANGVFDPSLAGAGTHTIIYSISSACGDTDTVQLTVNPSTNANAGSDRIICPGESVTLTATGGDTYAWNTGSTDSSITVSPGSPTTYIVTANNASNCPSSDTVVVEIYNNIQVYAGDDGDSVTQGESVTIDLIANDTGDASMINIFEGASKGTISLNNGKLTYTADEEAVGEDQLSYMICDAACNTYCDTATVTIGIREGIPPLFIPNGISPNGDGKNDKWVIEGLEAYPDHKLMIFNRWGDLLYAAQPYNNDWSGQTNKGIASGNGEIVEGTYYFILELGEEESPETGFIEIAK